MSNAAPSQFSVVVFWAAVAAVAVGWLSYNHGFNNGVDALSTQQTDRVLFIGQCLSEHYARSGRVDFYSSPERGPAERDCKRQFDEEHGAAPSRFTLW